MKRALWLLFLLIPTFAGSALAGAWSQAKGGYYLKTTLIYSDANKVLGISSPATFRDYSLYFYGEYGITPHLTGIVNFPVYKRSENEANFIRGETNAFLAGDYEAHLKYQFLNNGLVGAAQIGIKKPAFYDLIDIPPIGNNETDYDLKFLLGASLYPIPAYFTGDLGYRFRGGEFVDEFHMNAEAGYTVMQRYLLRATISVIRNNGESASESNLFGFPLIQQRTRVGGGVIFILSSKLEADLTLLKTTSGLNIPNSTEVFVGLALKR
ncbi:MAG: hypothetical protein KDI06_18955 [Calditrichaeota bacterium]|nr:hypothetical protein [Calditrichota bacterium]HQU72007.1 hypothetical protein [Calditrichia bacterium]